jgi:hypothetical protein
MARFIPLSASLRLREGSDPIGRHSGAWPSSVPVIATTVAAGELYGLAAATPRWGRPKLGATWAARRYPVGTQEDTA